MMTLQYWRKSPLLPSCCSTWASACPTTISVLADPDARSPFGVTVKEEGLYGFRIGVARAGVWAEQSPPSGVTPDVWVVVRVAKPQAAQGSQAPDPHAPAARIRDVRAPTGDER